MSPALVFLTRTGKQACEVGGRCLRPSSSIPLLINKKVISYAFVGVCARGTETVGVSNIGSSLGASRNHTTTSKTSKEIVLNWKLKDGSVKSVQASVGWTYLDVAHKYEIDLEGACAGVCACSTCHLIFEDDVYDRLPEATEAEDDMLDQAFQLTHTSRLGCQVLVTKDHAGTTVQLPAATRNFYVDGHVPKPH